MLTETTALAFLFGTTAGLVGGLLPGMGNLLSLMMIIPFMHNWNPVDVFICFVILVQTSQFVGSLTTIYTGIPGEPTSMPTVIEIKNIKPHEYAGTVALTAVGSFFASVLTIAFCYLASQYFTYSAYLLRTEIILFLLLLSTWMVCNYSSNRSMIVTSGLLLFGGVLGIVGWSNLFSTGILTFGVIELYQGIPTDVVLLCLFVMPQLFQLSNNKDIVKNLPKSIPLVWPRINFIKSFWYSIIGFVGGLVPGMTTILSSQAAYAAAARVTKDPKERIYASETGNNAGAISSMIPMILLGLPLVPSEAIVLAMMQSEGFVPSAESAAAYFQSGTLLFLLSAVLCLILAWPLAASILKILKINLIVVRATIFLVLLTTILFNAFVDKNMMYVIICFGVLSAVGLILRKKDTTSLVFGFFVSSLIIDYGFRMGDLYF
jgi:putative tricarboxylic transport membrane protein